MSYKLPSRTLVSQNDAAMIQRSQVPRSKFINKYNLKTTFDADYLIPIDVDEVLPGDQITMDIEAYVRMSTPLFPIFDSQRIDIFGFFVPCRLCWTNWKKFMGEQDSPADTIAYTIPTGPSPAGGWGVGSLQDYMGLPTVGQVTAGQVVDSNIMPLRAYFLIWNQWFRDENSINGLNVPLGDTTTETGYALQRRAKSHDYFTQALPAPQKFTAPTAPLAGQAPVIGLGMVAAGVGGAGASPVMRQTIGADAAFTFGMDNTANNWWMRFSDATAGARPQIFADLSAATGVDVNVIRTAFLVQAFLEQDARGGTRYTETVLRHFGVRSPDARLQRPEYIGGGQTPLNVTPIAQTTPTGGGGLGALGGAAIAAGNNRISYAATEHGYYIILANIKSELTYMQGLRRMWTRSTRFDFPYPALAGLGEQAVRRDEIYCTGDNALDVTTFGYVPRYDEMRWRYSTATNLFRSGSAGAIDQWHFGERFIGAPVLGATFIQSTTPMSRVLAAGASANGMQYLADFHFTRTMVRALPLHGTPATLGRF